jgi:Tfp pilus assembly protein PilF
MKFDHYREDDLEDILRVNLLYDPQKIKDLMLLGALLFSKCRYRQAATHLKRVLEYDPTNIDARFWLGMCFTYTDDLPSASRIIEEALKLDPHRADCLSLKASILWEKQKALAKSQLYFEKAIQFAPLWPLLHIELICIHISLGHFKEALEQIQIASELVQIPPRTPTNEAERCYEKMVTGRSWVNLDERLKYLRLRLEDAVKSMAYYF